MHRFLTAFLCLSTLAMTQNVVAGTPSPLQASEARPIAESVGVGAVRPSGADLTQGAVGSEVPAPTTMLLLVTGLAGLSAVGSRGGRPARVAPRP